MGKLALFIVTFLLIGQAIGQSAWDGVDTVTAGTAADLNPQIDHAGMSLVLYGGSYPDMEWIVFERWNDGVDAIGAVRFLGSSLKWDTTVSTPSPAEPGVEKKLPDVCTVGNGTSIATWQEKSDGAWNIKYSVCRIDSAKWGTPLALTSDTVDNTIPEVRGLSDSSLVVIWRKGSAILYAVYKSGAFSSADTLVQSNTDSTEFDFASSSFVWTDTGSSGNRICLLGTVENFTSFSLSAPDTISCDGDMTHPRFMINSFMAGKVFTFNLRKDERYSVWWSAYPGINGIVPEELAANDTADCMCGVFYGPAYLTGSVKPDVKKTNQVNPGQFFAYEERSTFDTVIVFYGLDSDNVQQGGNPCMSPLCFAYGGRTALGFVVWESSRTGTVHLYSRSFLWSNDAVDEPGQTANTFQLSQNYPNPFNPSTIISYKLSAVSEVRLVIYDVLGRKVETLVDARQNPGSHSAIFDARGLPSGIYFYRLRAGSQTQTRKMVVIK